MSNTETLTRGSVITANTWNHKAMYYRELGKNYMSTMPFQPKTKNSKPNQSDLQPEKVQIKPQD